MILKDKAAGEQVVMRVGPSTMRAANSDLQRDHQ